jgi:hypothetical protein
VKDFGNPEEPCKALKEMGRLSQGKKTMAEYFLRLEQLTSVVGIDINRSPHMILYVERNVNSILINQLYLSDNPPGNYQDYKMRIITMDKMKRRREANHQNPKLPSP